jgi:predicted nucleotidyltransferase
MVDKSAPGDEYVNPVGNLPTYIGEAEFKPGQAELFAEALRVLEAADVPVLIAGAFASHAYSGIWRNTKDLDLFLRPGDVHTALRALAEEGFETELRDPTWLAKAWKDPYLIDLIFGNGNRVLQVDDSWIHRGRPIEICGVRVRLISIEDLIASKLFIAKRDRFDGADVAHLIRSRGDEIDWERILERLPNDRLLLLWHIVLFLYAYPGHAQLVPRELVERLTGELFRLWDEPPPATAFRGTVIDHVAFAIDVADWGYEDPRPPEARVVAMVETGAGNETGVGNDAHRGHR